jgi:hypothetical protein
MIFRIRQLTLSGKTTQNAKNIFLRKHTKGKQFVFSRYFLRKY